MLLLLLWRHLARYAETDPAHPAVPPVNLRSTMRLLPAVDANSFKDEVGKRLVGALTRISSLDLVRGLCSGGHGYLTDVHDRARRRSDGIGSRIKGILRSCLGG